MRMAGWGSRGKRMFTEWIGRLTISSERTMVSSAGPEERKRSASSEADGMTTSDESWLLIALSISVRKELHPVCAESLPLQRPLQEGGIRRQVDRTPGGLDRGATSTSRNDCATGQVNALPLLLPMAGPTRHDQVPDAGDARGRAWIDDSGAAAAARGREAIRPGDDGPPGLGRALRDQAWYCAGSSRGG